MLSTIELLILTRHRHLIQMILLIMMWLKMTLRQALNHPATKHLAALMNFCQPKKEENNKDEQDQQ